MKLRNIAISLAAAASLPAAAPLHAADDPSTLSYTVIPTGEVSMLANMVLIEGEKEAILVDAPFARSDAHRVVAKILDSGKTLKAVFVTHDHPDHFFGLDVIQDAFPDARIVAQKQVAADMVRTVPIKIERWGPMLGANAPKRGVLPAALPDDTLTLEGHTLQVLGPMQGDHVHSTVLWDPETKVLVAGDVVYNDLYVWLGEHTPERYDAWIAVLDRLEGMVPNRVIAGHRAVGLPGDNMGIAWTRKYIRDFKAACDAAKTSQELSAAMMAKYPTTTEVYGDFLLGISSKVCTGEIPPWDE